MLYQLYNETTHYQLWSSVGNKEGSGVEDSLIPYKKGDMSLRCHVDTTSILPVLERTMKARLIFQVRRGSTQT